VLSDQGKVLKEVPLLALEDVAEGGLWRRMSDSVQKFFAD
jgi:D-alanyl-D-alanine carboxypeptidase (penicillin-binding protein 5/6)